MSAYEVENEKDFKGFMNEGVIDKFIQKPVTLNCLCEEVNDQVHAYQLKNECMNLFVRNKLCIIKISDGELIALVIQQMATN
jgi:hypothetical protein